MNFIDNENENVYPNGFAIVLATDNDEIVGILFADMVNDDLIHGVLRKKTDKYGYSGIAVKRLDHRFRPIAVIGLYIKPKFRGNNFCQILIQDMEEQLINEYANYYYYQSQDLPLFQFYDDGMFIAKKSLKYSYAVSNIKESKNRREELHNISSSINTGIILPSWKEIFKDKYQE